MRHQVASHLAVGLLLPIAYWLSADTKRTWAEGPEPIPIVDLDRAEPVNFGKEILPILRKNCLACHNASDAESDLVLETPQTIRKGGVQGPAVLPAKSDESLLLQVAAHRQDPVMPPVDNDRGATSLTPQELGVIKRWIDEGAEGNVTDSSRQFNWQQIPDKFRPILATAITDNGRYAACSRANRLYVYHLPTGELVAELVDPGLSMPGGGESISAAHLDVVQSLAFSPAGDLLASGGFRTVKMWRRPRNARLSETELGATTGVLAMSAERRWLATGEPSGTIRLCDLAGESEVRMLHGHSEAVTALEFSADGLWLCSGSQDKTIRLWNLSAGQPVGGFAVPVAAQAIAWIHEASQIITGGADHVIYVWPAPPPGDLVLADTQADQSDHTVEEPLEFQPGTSIRQLTGHEQDITAVANLPSAANQFISGSLDGTVRYWDASTGGLIRKFDHGAPVTSLAVRPDGKRFISVSGDGAKLWNAENGQLVAEMQGDQRINSELEKLDRAIYLAKAEAADRNKSLGDIRNEVKPTEEALQRANEFSATGNDQAIAAVKVAEKAVAAAQQKIAAKEKNLADAEKQLRALRSAKTEATARADNSRGPISSATFSGDNVWLALGDHQHRIQLFDASTGTLLDVMEGHASPIQAARFAVDGNLITIDAKGKMIRWDVQPGWILERTIGRVDDSQSLSGLVLAIDFCPDGKLLATGSGEPSRTGQLKIWRVADGQLVQAVDDAHSDTIFAVKFSPDGQTLASSGADRMVKTFRVADGQVQHSFEGHTHHALAVDWQANGRRLASAGADNVIKLWDPQTGDQQRTIDGYQKEVTSISFVGAGSAAISSSGDATVRLRNTDDGQEIRQFQGAKDFVYSAVASADGEMVVAGGHDGILRLWNGKTGELRESFSPPQANAEP